MLTFWSPFFLAILFFSTAVYAEDPIYIGLSAPMSGRYESYGTTFQKAIELAVDRLNHDGGIMRRPIEIVVEDSEGDPQMSKKIARTFTRDERIVAVIGDFTSSSSMAAQPLYHRAGLVQLSPTSSHPSFAPGSPFSFSIVRTQAGEGAFMAQSAVETLGKKRVAVLYINNDWGIAAQKFFVEQAQQLGAEVVSEETYLEGTSEFLSPLEAIRKENPDFLYLCTMDKDGATILTQLRQLESGEMAIGGTSSLSSQQLIELGGDAVDGVYTNTSFFLKDPRPEVQKFIQEYEKKYAQSPNLFAGLAYDAINLLAESIRNGGDRSSSNS